MEIRIKTDELRKRKLFLATPMYGGQCHGMFTKSVADLTAKCAEIGIQLTTYFLFNESLITRARNYCCDEFIRSQSTHMLFIDSDIGFRPDDVIAMLALSSDESEYDVLCAPYPKKFIAWEKIKKAVDKGFADENPNNLEKFVGDFVFNAKPGTTSFSINDPVEILEGGTGFMMIKRSVFERYTKAFPELHYRPDHVRAAHFDGSREIMAFFDCVIDRGYTFDDIKLLMKDLAAGGDTKALMSRVQAMLDAESKASKRYLSEDYMFCQNVLRMGGKIWLCPWMVTQHTGSFVFGGTLSDLAQLGASATADVNEMDKIKKAQAKKEGK